MTAKRTDSQIQTDMHERVANIGKEVLATHLAVSRWAKHAAVTVAMDNLLTAASRVAGALAALQGGAVVVGKDEDGNDITTRIDASYIARPDSMKPEVGWRVDVADASDRATLQSAFGEPMVGLTVVAVSGSKLFLRGAHGAMIGPYPMSKVCASAPLAREAPTSTHAMPSPAVIASDASATPDAGPLVSAV